MCSRSRARLGNEVKASARLLSWCGGEEQVREEVEEEEKEEERQHLNARFPMRSAYGRRKGATT